MCKTSPVMEKLTNTIIASLEKGKVPWKKPWNTSPKRINGKEYRGFNRLHLSIEAMDKEYKSPYWATFNHITRKLKGDVTGQHGVPVLYWKVFRGSKISKDGEITSTSIPYMRYSTVFNIDQVAGLENKSRYYPAKSEAKPIEICEKVIEEYPEKPVIKYNGNNAYYLPIRDEIVVPPPESFMNISDFYSALYHEATHSTGHISRLDRKEVMDGNLFGSHDYAIEELVAELGACFLCSYCGIETKTIENTTAYIQNWLGVLKDDRRLLINAAARAQKAVDHILHIKYEEEENDE